MEHINRRRAPEELEQGERIPSPPRQIRTYLPGAPGRPPQLPFRLSTFAAFRHRNFRLFYGGQILSLVGSWMQITALGWLVLELTDSEFMLGLVNSFMALPILLFTLLAGVYADRAEKRRILILAQVGMLAVAIGLAVMTDLGVITVAWILLLVFMHGTFASFEIPTRQSFFIELVGRDDLTNAIALNSAAFNLTRMIGPALAGLLISTVGIAVAFYLNAVSFFFVLASLILIRLPRFRPRQQTASKWENMVEGFAYLRRDRISGMIVGLIAAISILGLPYAALMPVFARDILEVGAQGLGWLLAAVGVGATAGGFLVATVGSSVRRGRLLLASAVSFSVLLAAFALSPWFWVSMAVLVLFGFAMIVMTATANALIQSQVPDELRGRVMAVYVFMFLGMMPIGSFQAGAVASWIGAPAALAIGAGLLLMVVLATIVRAPSLRALR